MKRLHFKSAASFALLCCAAPTLAQQALPPATAQPAEPEEPIVVTGERAAEALVVDVEKIALRCIACRRAIQRLRSAAARRSRSAIDDSEAAAGAARRPGARDSGSDFRVGGVDTIAFAAEVHRNAVRQEQEARGRAGRMLDVSTDSDRFIRNLLRFVEPIVERHRLERGAEAVYAPRDREARGRNFPDITEAVIEEIDRNHRDVDLLEGTAP